MDSTENEAIVHHFLEAFRDRDLDAASDLITPGFVRHEGEGSLPGWAGPDGWAGLVRLLVNALPDLRLEIREVQATGDRAVAYLSAFGTHLGEFLGMPPTGKAVCFDSVDLYRLEGGKIAESWPMPDLAGVRRVIDGPPCELGGTHEVP